MTTLLSIQLNDGSHSNCTKNTCPAEHPTPRPSGGGLAGGGLCLRGALSMWQLSVLGTHSSACALHAGTSPHGRALIEYRLRLRRRLATLPLVFPHHHGPRAHLPGPDRFRAGSAGSWRTGHRQAPCKQPGCLQTHARTHTSALRWRELKERVRQGFSKSCVPSLEVWALV